MSQHRSRLRQFLGPAGSARRRWLRDLPVLGPVLRIQLRVYRGLRQRRVDVGLALERARTDLKNRRATTVRNVTRKNNRRAYERVYSDDQLLSEYVGAERVAFYAEVAELCESLQPRSVIDVGCGAGDLLQAVVERASPERVVGVDYARAGIERARQLVPSGEFRAEDIYTLGEDETYDLVLCTEVLEHLSAPDAAMSILVRLCSPAGAIVITVPDGAADSWEGHRNFWTKSDLHEFLGSYGEVEVSRMHHDEASLLAIIKPLPAGQEQGTGEATLPFRV